MPPHYVSFVIRVLVGDDGEVASGRVYRVPDQDGQYFRTWDELVVLLKALLGGKHAGNSTAHDDVL